jgi:hypothetical protein
MAAATLSNAESLRVIGQDLNALGINVFNLGKKNDEYTLWVEERKSGKQLSGQKALFKKITQTISAPAGEISKPIHFSSSEILWAHVAQGIKRKASDGVTNLHDLSILLRVLGDHLDKKSADDFIIFWSANWVKVVYGNKEENFTLLNLYEVGGNMYLKRSTGRPAN